MRSIFANARVLSAGGGDDEAEVMAELQALREARRTHTDEVAAAEQRIAAAQRLLTACRSAEHELHSHASRRRSHETQVAEAQRDYDDLAAEPLQDSAPERARLQAEIAALNKQRIRAAQHLVQALSVAQETIADVSSWTLQLQVGDQTRKETKKKATTTA